ncbi:MAG: ABC transporter substrate-binding protein [Pirellulales bacterium]
MSELQPIPQPFVTRRQAMARAARWSGASWLAASGLSALGCQRGGNSSGGAGSTLQLNWYPDAQHGGFYAADTLGLFREAGLSIKIAPGGPSITSLNKLVLKQVDYAIANADQILLARAQQADIVAVFAALQQSPRCVMVHAASGIETWDQLNDVVLAIGEGQPFAEYLKQRIPLRNVRIVPYTGDISAWTLDPRYAQQAYSFTEPLLATQRGGDPRVLMVSDLGYNPYTSVVVVRRSMWQDQQAEVEKAVRAIRAGWQRYLQDPAATNDVIHQVNATVDRELLAKSVDAIRPLCLAGLAGEDQLGTMTTERWATLHQQLLDLKMLDRAEPDINRVFVSV